MLFHPLWVRSFPLWLLFSPAVGPLFSARSGSALLFTFAVTVNHPSDRCFLWTHRPCIDRRCHDVDQVVVPPVLMSQRMDLILASNVPHDVMQVLVAAWVTSPFSAFLMPSTSTQHPLWVVNNPSLLFLSVDRVVWGVSNSSSGSSGSVTLQSAHELHREVDVLLLVPVVRPKHEGFWPSHALHLSDELGRNHSVCIRLEICPFITTGTSATSTMNDNSTIFQIFWMVGTVSAHGESQSVFGISLTVIVCLCAVNCPAGVFATLSDCWNLNLTHLYCSLLDLNSQVLFA